MTTIHPHDPIVFTGAGMLSRAGDDVVKHIASMTAAEPGGSAESYSLKAFKPAPYMTDKRILKAVSATDALGIVAIEQLRKDAGLDGETYNAERVGLYVGAPPASAWNASDYFDAMRSSRDGARIDPLAFGKECMNSRPTALLTGLPNNVLCYGAILLDAKGPNSNYTSAETSGQMAVMNAARRVTLGKLDAAVAGAFSAHAEPIMQSMLEQNGMLKVGGEAEGFCISPGSGGTISAEGAFFYMMERQGAAEKRGAKVYAEFAGGGVGSSAHSPFARNCCEEAVGIAARRCLAQAGISTHDIGLVLASATGVAAVDMGERRALDALFENTPKPAMGTTARIWGNLSEAGGLGEIALVKPLYERGSLPEAMRLDANDMTTVEAQRPYVLIVRTSVFGEASCLLVRNVD